MRRIAIIFVMFFIAFLVVGCRNKGCGKNTGVKEYDLTNISFSDVNVIYDGEEHSVLLDGDLPEGLEVEYQNNKLTNVGSTSATATIKEKETQEVLKVLTANLSIDKRIVKVRVNDIYIKYGEEPKDDEYKFIEGSFVESDLGKLNINIAFTKRGMPGFVATFYDAVDLEYTPNSNYEITVEKGDVTIYNSELSLSDVIVYCNSDAYTEECFANLENIIDYDSSNYRDLENDYYDTPLFSSINEKGDVIEFYFDYLTTTFNLVKKDNNGNVIKIINSSREKTIMELNYQIINNPDRIYSFSNYDESVSDRNIYYDKVTPNYSIYLEKDELGNETKLIVSYLMAKRGIDYSYFPKYISKEKMDEYFERNKTLVENGALTSNGDSIIDIKSNNRLYTEFCKNNQSYYKLVPAIITEYGQEKVNPANQFGYDYYELSMEHSNMSGLVRDTLYKCLYEYSGYTEQDLIADNKEFNYEIGHCRPEFKVVVEYKLVDGILYISVSKSLIIVDEECYLVSIEMLPYVEIEE